MDDYPLRFFRILQDIDPDDRLSYETKEINKRVLDNFGIELKYDEQENNWSTKIIKIQK